MIRRDFLKHVLSGTTGITLATLIPDKKANASLVQPKSDKAKPKRTAEHLSKRDKYIRDLVRTVDELMPIHCPARTHPLTEFDHLQCGALPRYEAEDGPAQIAAYSLRDKKNPCLFEATEFLVPTYEYAMMIEPSFDKSKDIKTLMDHFIMKECQAWQEIASVIPGKEWSRFMIVERQSFTMLACGPGPKYPKFTCVAYHETGYAMIV